MDPKDVTVVGLLIAIGLAGMRKVWVWGYQLIEMTEDRNFWRGAFLRSTGLTEGAMRIAESPKDRSPDG